MIFKWINTEWLLNVERTVEVNLPNDICNAIFFLLLQFLIRKGEKGTPHI